MNRIASYDSMSREQLIARLKVAEDALVLIGWSSTDLGSFEGTDRGDAAHQMWSMWAHMVMGGTDLLSPGANPEIDAMVPEPGSATSCDP